MFLTNHVRSLKPFLRPFMDLCLLPPMPSLTTVPTAVMFSWAVGSDSFTMPPDVGLALGGTSANVHSALQIHYSNYGKEKTTDGSGLELQVTSKLPCHMLTLLLLWSYY